MLDYVGKSPFSLSDTTDYMYVHKTVKCYEVYAVDDGWILLDRDIRIDAGNAAAGSSKTGQTRLGEVRQE